MSWQTASMTNSSPVFLDANVLVYALDQTSEPYAKTVEAVQRLLGEDVTLCTSHHVIEEVLHVVSKIPQSGVTSSQVIEEIALIPNLVLIEPAADLDFARRYATLSERLNMGVNDALLLQLMIDAGIWRLFSYDKKFVNRASVMDIEPIA
jgi:predicted nucleic acid-binding protein